MTCYSSIDSEFMRFALNKYGTATLILPSKSGCYVLADLCNHKLISKISPNFTIRQPLCIWFLYFWYEYLVQNQNHIESLIETTSIIFSSFHIVHSIQNER